VGDANNRQEVEGLFAQDDQRGEIRKMSVDYKIHPIFGMMDALLKIKVIRLESRVRFMRIAVELLIDEDVTMWWINKKSAP
jgi:hypothetical protein